MEKDYVKELVEILAELRGRDGCPWDRQQTHHSLKRYLVEETGELLDAIDDEDDDAMVDELGDVLLQIVFHCQIASENRRFDLQDAARSECEKMIRRHPHVFGDSNVEHADGVLEQWEVIKRQEKPARAADSAVDGVPRNLPALHRAQKMLRKAGRAGFEWPDLSDAVDKVDEEMAEVHEAMERDDRSDVEAELGDLLFAVVNLCRWYDLEAEDVLQQSIRSFEKRFKSMERTLRQANKTMRQCSAEQLLEEWRAAAGTMEQDGS